MPHRGQDHRPRFNVEFHVITVLGIFYWSCTLSPIPVSKKTPSKHLRNQLIVERYHQGDSLDELARDYQLSPQRVHELVRLSKL